MRPLKVTLPRITYGFLQIDFIELLNTASYLRKAVARETKINMLPSRGQPDLDAAANLMVPLILEAIYLADVQKNSGKNSDADSDQKTPAIAPADQPDGKES